MKTNFTDFKGRDESLNINYCLWTHHLSAYTALCQIIEKSDTGSLIDSLPAMFWYSHHLYINWYRPNELIKWILIKKEYSYWYLLSHAIDDNMKT